MKNPIVLIVFLALFGCSNSSHSNTAHPLEPQDEVSLRQQTCEHISHCAGTQNSNANQEACVDLIMWDTAYIGNSCRNTEAVVETYYGVLRAMNGLQCEVGPDGDRSLKVAFKAYEEMAAYNRFPEDGEPCEARCSVCPRASENTTDIE